jgi:hypothetical protein
VFIFFHFCRRHFAAEVWDAKGLAIPRVPGMGMNKSGKKT